MVYPTVWQPPNISALCPAHTHLTACTPFALVYLDLVTRLFGAAPDHARETRDAETYDFIVVGAGSAGCVVANRLSAVEDWKVLLLEAGPEEPEITSVPALYPTLQNSNLDWQYKTLPSRYSCLAFPDQRCAWPRGKTMGGSSSINGMVYVRGNILDYDGWAARGNVGWSYRDVLPYFKKSERNLNIEALDRKYHGVNGEQAVSRYPFVDIPSIMMTEAFNEGGLPLNDYNAAVQYGTMVAQATSKQGQRASTNRAFITPIRYKRKSLSIKPNAEVFKILFDEHKRATGVKYIKDGHMFTAFAKKEVIVSGGTINSPKLLMLSGIGPKEHLDDLHIPVIQDLPVGKNLQDHVGVNGVVIVLSNETATTVSQEELLAHVYEYKNMEIKRGPLSGTGPGTVVSFYLEEPDLPAPEIELQVEGVNWKEYMRDPAAYTGVPILPNAFYDGVLPRVANIVPKSRGQILLNASDPHGHPLIRSGYLTDPRDLVVLLRGMKRVLALESTHAFKSRGAHFVKTPLPACRHLHWGTDVYFECLARAYTYTEKHYAGTCRMGPKEDPTAVVDPRLRVYGVSGLRVIDASIMPRVVRGNTNAPSIMIGERGVAFVLEDWLHNYKEYNY